ncbi:unnamed protein product [Soboliphyme baturini]|uniref:DUF4982 domain-containing protein n=1 Tax=Soboliphyme baturini TaxID=241478 RepID=A0A183J4D1_9BILA|nr:unnamed protein product [Soboliphyme baturini]
MREPYLIKSNFLGDWQVSVLYDGEHIRGSPFMCKVFDAGLVEIQGLEAGSIGEEIAFTVDARVAGSGTITVEALHNHRPVRTFVEQLDVQLYRAHFIPAGAGKYDIHVWMNDVEINGSPFLLDVVDKTSIAVSGDGLSMASVDNLATFMIKAAGVDSQDLVVTITAPSGKTKRARIIALSDSTYRAEWKPIETGKQS